MSLLAAVRIVSTVLRPHMQHHVGAELGAQVSEERARNLVQVWSCDERITESEAAEQIGAAREPHYGNVPLSDAEVDSLAARVVFALECV